MKDFKDNPNAPSIRFIRKNGRVIPIISGNSKGVKPKVASQIVSDQVDVMKEAVKNADAGRRYINDYGKDTWVGSSKSSFPKWYESIGAKNKEDFYKILEKPGVRQERVMEQAVKDIKSGENYGFDGVENRSTEFKVATREVFDNRNVIFRKLNGQVVPIRTKKPSSTKEVDWSKFRL